jgi:hypothetical protein
MKLYNEETDKDIIIREISESIRTGLELDMPFVPPKNDGTLRTCLVVSEGDGFVSYLFDSKEFASLYQEVLEKEYPDLYYLFKTFTRL